MHIYVFAYMNVRTVYVCVCTGRHTCSPFQEKENVRKSNGRLLKQSVLCCIPVFCPTIKIRLHLLFKSY